MWPKLDDGEVGTQVSPTSQACAKTVTQMKILTMSWPINHTYLIFKLFYQGMVDVQYYMFLMYHIVIHNF